MWARPSGEVSTAHGVPKPRPERISCPFVFREGDLRTGAPGAGSPGSGFGFAQFARGLGWLPPKSKGKGPRGWDGPETTSGLGVSPCQSLAAPVTRSSDATAARFL